MSIGKMPRSSGRSDPELVKCRSVTLDQITEIDRELLADRYGAAVMKEFREVATWWFQMHLDELIAKSRAHGRVSMNGSNFFLKTDEIVIEYDYEFELLSRIRREGAKALTASYANFFTDILLRSPRWTWKRPSQRWPNTAMARKVSSMASGWMYGHDRIMRE